MIVALDTCIIGQDFNLDGISFRLLFDNQHFGKHKVVVPEVVVQETVNHFRERLAAEVGKAAAAGREIAKMTGEAITSPPTDQKKAVEIYERTLRHRVGYGGSSILPLPKVTQQKLLDRALTRRKPFNTGGNGYRDALIWECILKYARAHPKDRIAFLTNNTKDFCESEKLHPDLTKDLISAKLPADHVVIYTSLLSFIEKEVIPSLPKPHKAFLDYLKKWPDFRLKDSISRLLLDQLPSKYIDAEVLGKPSYFEDPSVSMVGEPDVLEILDEHKTQPKQRVLELRTEIECLFDCYIEKHEYWCLEGDEQPSASEWNETYMSSEFYATISVRCYATFDEQKGDLVDIEITDIERVKAM